MNDFLPSATSNLNDSLVANPHISEYLRSLVPDWPEWLMEIERRAKQEEVPIIRKEAQGLLRFLLTMRKPEAILEIGTAVGFSASLMEYFTGFTVPLTTIEKVPARIEAANHLFGSRPELSGITLLTGDAAEVLDILAAEGRTFDFVFLDAAKAQYPVYLEKLRALLRDGAMLIADNVLQEGSVAESKFTVCRRDRTIHMRMREFVKVLFEDPSFVSTMIPVGDGMTASVYHRV